ncbi:MAG: bifunctional acetate--CoA ligase family protein/GNAT family N-acetyltransferase [Deltaproteobacteria bacterium]|nr:bifunctional acetate--CoA ligase family protein/GNAT family N-acetyltransferase [Candidatus Anaeroferrophillus wilburensis]MBN2889823.1 bifunctional acetate--CoA ligase family protein/GNAT family N-acetyltransferase [Deltaproteobacteria bacterium]
MGIYNLDHLFAPRTIGLIGHFDCRSCKEQVVYRNLRDSRVGRTLLINMSGCDNPDCPFTAGGQCYPAIAAVPDAIDLLIASLPLSEIPALLDDCRHARVKNIVIARGGLAVEDEQYEQLITNAAQRQNIRLLGFNSFGLIVPGRQFNTSFFETAPDDGKIALISQSGAVISSILDMAREKKVGFSHVVSLGSLVDVDFGDMIDYLGWEYNVRCILLYIENLKNVKKFLSACRSVARVKPIVAVKGGKTALSQAIIKKHTGRFAGEDRVYDTALRRAGIIRVESISDLLAAGVALVPQAVLAGEQLGIITNSGGVGVMAVDNLASRQVQIHSLSAALGDRMREYIAPYSGTLNPVCIASDADNQRFIKVIRLCLESREFDTLMVIMVLSGFLQPEKIIAAVRCLAEECRVKMLYILLGNREVYARRVAELENRGTSIHFSVEEATNSYYYGMRYYAKLNKVVVVPPRFNRELTYHHDEVRELIAARLGEARQLLSETESKQILQLYELPVNPTDIVKTLPAALAAGDHFGYPVVLKNNDPVYYHKSDSGGVILNIHNRGTLKRAWMKMLAVFGEPGADGFTVQPLVEPVHYELTMGAGTDREFGPYLFLGMGGLMSRVVRDEAVILPPLNRFLARKLIEKTALPRCRQLRPFTMEVLEEILVRLSQLVVDFPEIYELHVDPLVISNNQFRIVDAKIVLKDRGVISPNHLATTPYPNQYEFTESLRDGTEVLIRPIKPEDAEAHYAMIDSFSHQTRYNRFFSHEKHIGDAQMVRFTQIDYDREIAIVAKIRQGERELSIGTNRLVYYPHNDEYEFAIVVADDWQNSGVGSLLMDKLLVIARDRQIKRIYGLVLMNNLQMMKFIKKFGFRVVEYEEDVARIQLVLD